jgi:hypothetical protein
MIGSRAIAAAQQARQLRAQAQAAEEAQLLGAAASTAVEGDLATSLHLSRYTMPISGFVGR